MNRQQQEKFIVRFPDGMRDKLSEAAKASGRSMNAEIVHRIAQSFNEAATAITEEAVRKIVREEIYAAGHLTGQT